MMATAGLTYSFAVRECPPTSRVRRRGQAQAAIAGSIATVETEASRTSPTRPVFETKATPRARPGAIMTTMAGSTSSSPTSTRHVACTTRGMAHRDVAVQAGVAGPMHYRATACWFWDFDNDGRLDLFVNDSHASLADVVASYWAQGPVVAIIRSIYRNIGAQGFREASRDLGLDRPILAFGTNFGELTTMATLTSTLRPGGHFRRAPSDYFAQEYWREPF